MALCYHPLSQSPDWGIMQCRGVVNTAVMTTTRQPGESRAAAGGGRTETFALVTFYLHHFREGSGPPCACVGDINNVLRHKDFPATSHDISTELWDNET